MLLLTMYKEFENQADVAQTRRTVIVETSGSESGGGVIGPRRRTKKRINISQDAFRREGEKWKFIAERFTEGTFQRPSAEQCKNKYQSLNGSYLAIGRVQTRTRGGIIGQ